MTFRAALATEFRIHDAKLPADSTLEFNKTEIIFPKSLSNGHYTNRNIRDGTTYELITHFGRTLQYRYEIKFVNGDKERLSINKNNERLLKQIHKLSWYHKYDIKYDLLKMVATAILSVIVSLLVWKLTNLSKSRLNDEQEKRLDSLNYRIDSLLNAYKTK